MAKQKIAKQNKRKADSEVEQTENKAKYEANPTERSFIPTRLEIRPAVVGI